MKAPMPRPALNQECLGHANALLRDRSDALRRLTLMRIRVELELLILDLEADMSAGPMGGPGWAPKKAREARIAGWFVAPDDRVQHYYTQGGGQIAFAWCNKRCHIDSLDMRISFHRCKKCERRHTAETTRQLNDQELV